MIYKNYLIYYKHSSNFLFSFKLQFFSYDFDFVVCYAVVLYFIYVVNYLFKYVV